MIQILIADDHTMFADGIASIVKAESDMEVIGQTPTGKGVFTFLEQHQVDLILLDMNLLDMTGIEVSQTLTVNYPNLKILVISMFNQESYITEILKYGVSGYILKNTDKTELLRAIRTVAKGGTYFSDAVTSTIMQSLVNQNKTQASKKEIPKLTRREKEVLNLIAKEYTTQEIANQLFINIKTVESHRRSLLTKFEVRNAVGLIRVAMKHQLIDL